MKQDRLAALSNLGDLVPPVCSADSNTRRSSSSHTLLPPALPFLYFLVFGYKREEELGKVEQFPSIRTKRKSRPIAAS